MGRTSEQWDRVYTVDAMADDDGTERRYINAERCFECGSEFPEHRCHLEEDS
jgi:hypothetical protein